MALLVKIAELLLIIAAVRFFLRLVPPAGKKNRPSGEPTGPVARFDGKEFDISDADYEDVN